MARGSLLDEPWPTRGLGLDFGVMLGALAVLVALAARLYPTIVR